MSFFIQCMLILEQGGAMTIKLDMSKAYNKVEMTFFEECYTPFGLQFAMRGVMKCFKSTSFSFLINVVPPGNVILNKRL